MNSLKQYIDLYGEHAGTIRSHAPELLNARRAAALAKLEHAALPEKGDEKYPALSVNDMFAPDFGVNITRMEFPLDTTATFRCGVPNVSTLMALVVNDSYRDTTSLLRNVPEGVTMMSLAKACEEFPGIVESHLGKLADTGEAAVALNDLLLQDGVFVRIARGVSIDKPLQLVNIFNAISPILGIRRMLIIVEDDARASMLVCDHSQMPDVDYLSDVVTEIFVGENARFDFYELEESSARTSRLSHVYASQATGSSLTINGSTLLGGISRNDYVVSATGRHTDTSLAGMVIGTDSQVVDNCTEVRHIAPDSTSRQMFKYVLDGKATGSFYGTIVVDGKATNTNAYQSNKNILASETARMHTRPQLEIYCDEVKCSHGATIGQLDSNALFYMRSRGIPLAEAKLMLTQAFMSDVIDTVEIPALKTRLTQLVEQRLCGNHTLCADCDMAH